MNDCIDWNACWCCTSMPTAATRSKFDSTACPRKSDGACARPLYAIRKRSSVSCGRRLHAPSDASREQASCIMGVTVLATIGRCGDPSVPHARTMCDARYRYPEKWDCSYAFGKVSRMRCSQVSARWPLADPIAFLHVSPSLITVLGTVAGFSLYNTHAQT